ncbi:MAG TPA: MBL fold metallo-hydrolase [Candidatus Tumulicola sp.]
MTTDATRLRIVGSSPSVPRPGRACSSYLVRTARTSLLLDCGSGALSSLREEFDYAALDAIVVTHMHADHFVDLLPLRYGLTYGPSFRATALPLWLPPGGEATLRTVCSAFGRDGAADFLAPFEIREYSDAQSVDARDITLSFAAVRHYIDAFAVRVRTPSGTLTYSGDSAPCDALVDLARDSDLFLCEVTIGTGNEDEPRGHSSAREAGHMAAAARARALALTHYPAECPIAALHDEAAREFDGQVTIVDDGMELEVTRS